MSQPIYSLFSKRKASVLGQFKEKDIYALFLEVGYKADTDFLKPSKSDLFQCLNGRMTRDQVKLNFRDKLLTAVSNVKSANTLESQFWWQLANADKPIIFVDSEPDSSELFYRRFAVEALITARLILGYPSSCMDAQDICTKQQIADIYTDRQRTIFKQFTPNLFKEA